ALRAQLARLRQPVAAMEVLRPILPAEFKLAGMGCTTESIHSDRFVLRAQVRSGAGEERSYALKVYSDGFGEHVWAYAQELAADRSRENGLCLPIAFLPHERLLIFPWVHGPFLSEISDGRKPELLRQAARLAAGLHQLDLVPEAVTTAPMLVDETRAWFDRLRARWPEAAPLVEPVMEAAQAALPCLEPTQPAPVHGDMAAGQFLWTGERLVLLDL